jgi:methionyl-tRNA synthetase
MYRNAVTVYCFYQAKMKKTFYITTPIYYATARPHLGHAFTTVTADVIARYHRQNKEDVFLLTGTDEHGAKVAECAAKETTEPQVFVDTMAAEYQAIWKMLDIKNENFIRTTSPEHITAVQELLRRVHKAGDIYQADYEGLYCLGCEKFLTEKDLLEGKCPDHKTTPKTVKEKNYFFKLSRYTDTITKKIKSGELEILPKERANEVLGILEAGLPDFSLSREKLSWGIPLEFDPKQTVYVWVDALINYLSGIGFPDKKYETYWPVDVHVIGAEINKFHAIFWPALLLSAGVALPKKLFVHGLFTINGEKMSKSRGNIIDPSTLIERYGVDATRFLLLSQFSAERHGNVAADLFDKQYNDTLANGFGNLLSRVTKMLSQYGVKADPSLIDPVIAAFVKEHTAEYHEHLKKFQLFEALQSTIALCQRLNQFVEEKKPWALKKVGDDKSLQQVLSTLASGTEALFELLIPFMPTKSAEALKGLRDGNVIALFPRIT